MLTRLKVSGFKNLLDVDVRFGPFTCIAGANGVGKSNLFDAIRFLSATADLPLVEAASLIRDKSGRTADVRSLFFRQGDLWQEKMRFEAEMIVPETGLDDLGQEAKASITFLRYSLELGYRGEENYGTLGPLEVLKEGLVHVRLGDAVKHLLFDHKASTWRKTAVKGRRSGKAFISTVESKNLIQLHQDTTEGRTKHIKAANLPRTVLSSTNAVESPTALLARREMQSWKLLQLEPSSLREPDKFSAPAKLGADGSHLPATLYRLGRAEMHRVDGEAPQDASSRVYATVANRLSELIDDARGIDIDRDEKRELLTLHLTGNDGTSHAARSLSDGTLRFLALAVLERDPEEQGVICLEEPENGIHPERIPAMIRLLEDIATNAKMKVGPDNPLRQVIINTHSPAVVQQVPEGSLVVADLAERFLDETRARGVRFSVLPGNWRLRASQKERPEACSLGKMLSYLDPVLSKDEYEAASGQDSEDTVSGKSAVRRKRVIDRKDMNDLKEDMLTPIGYGPSPAQ